ncbi:lactose regulatory protein lac9 and GAL4-like protein [Arachnomyces sp. PD_36]|nr:lactose regulatory protein lac9 and GAL4-like protein [Arachnomyces sp. PD_36]
MATTATSPQVISGGRGSTSHGLPYSATNTPSSRSQPQRTSSFSLETPPTSGDFEWDERNGVASGEKFVDGMGSLGGESGYLGVASGAALLRITDPRSRTMEFAQSAQNQSADASRGDGQHHQTIPFSLTSLSQLEPFIDAYFRLYHQSYPIVYEAMFRAQFMEVIPRPAGNSWQVLLFSIAAIGAFSAATEPTTADIGLFDAARARLSIDMLETGNLILVQALTLISNYLQKRNKPNSGYNYTGLARRIAMGIGLHKEYPNWDASPLTLEMRRRAWYCLYIFDVGAIITFSRPLDFPDGGIDVELPMNVHDSDITAATKQKPEPANETTLYTHLRAQATLHLATCQIYPKIISASLPSAKELIELDDMLIGQWLTSLPAYFQENVLQAPKSTLCHSILRWRYRNFRILMYRPFLVRRLMSRPTDRSGETDVEPQDDIQTIEIAIQRCLDAAEESVDLISHFWNHDQQTMLACWYGLYFLFQAVLIPVICLRNDPQSPLALRWRDQIMKAMRVIESMVLLNPTAKRCLDVIQSLCGAYLAASTGGQEWGSPTQESPQTQLAGLYPLMWPTLESAQFEGVDSIMQESTIMDFMNQISGFE